MKFQQDVFSSNIRNIHRILSETEATIQSLYQLVDKEGQITATPWNGKDLDEHTLATFLKKLGLPNTKENRLAFLTRVINLRQESLQQSWKKQGHTHETIETFQDLAYQIVRDFHQSKHDKMIEEVLQQNLLIPFYQKVLLGWNRAGKKMSLWQSEWTDHILNKTNKALAKQFDDDDVAVNKYLEEQGLKDKGHWGKIADRCYSVLVKNEKGNWESCTYAKAFPNHVEAVCAELQTLIQELEPLEDTVYNEKDAWIGYLNALINAFQETNPDQCVARWADVDREWMGITGRIQPGHPLEYYEDHYRKAVALEWDIRISNPEHSTEGVRKRKIQKFAQQFFQEKQFGQTNNYSNILDFCLKKLESVQLHIGSVFNYYGADFMGLPSAQVVPNDEIVSKEKGKKIFAFPDDVIQSKQNRPFLRFTREIFGQEFLKRQRTILFQQEDLWFKIYDISTIGHEYGHILWVDQDTEPLMDHGGNFKNVEEWKATSGGLMTFFQEENLAWEMKQAIIEEMLSRSVGLFAWRETAEVLPYYIEGHIHLSGLFATQIIQWDVEKRQLQIELTPERFEKLKEWYFQTYGDLVENYYLPKKDPTPFVQKYVTREKHAHFFNAADPVIYDFQKHFWEVYNSYGQEIDTVDSPSNYRSHKN